MQWTDTNTNVRFERRPRPGRNRLIAILVGLGVFILLWELVPRNTLFWLLLPSLAVLLWMASYAWRLALAVLIAVLRRLEQL